MAIVKTTTVLPPTSRSDHSNIIIALPDGGFAVATTWNATEAGANAGDVRLATYDADGTPRGSTSVENIVSTLSDGLQQNVAMTALDDGTIAVLWTDDQRDAVYVRRFDTDGVAIDAAQIEVGTLGSGTPIITALENGRFAVGYQSNDGRPHVTVYDPAAMSAPVDIELSSGTHTPQQIIPTPDGGFFAIWIGANPGPSTGYLTRYDATGQKIGADLDADYDDYFDATGTLLPDGNVALTTNYRKLDGGASNYDAFFLIVHPVDGIIAQQRLGEDARFQSSPEIVVLEDGSLVVWWNDLTTPNSSDTKQVFQIYDSSGHAVGGLTEMSSSTTQTSSSVCALEDGGFAVAVWESSASRVSFNVFEADGSERYSGQQVLTGVTGTPSLTALQDGDFAMSWLGSQGGLQRTQVATFHFNPDAPFAEDAGAEAVEDDSAVIDADAFGFADINGDAFVSVTITELPDHGVLKLDGTVITAGMVSAGTVVLSKADLDAGKLTWTPDADFNGTSTVKFTLLDDGDIAGRWGGENQSGEQSMTLTTVGVNDGVAGSDRTVTATEDAGHVFRLADFPITDAVDGDELGAVIISGLPANGALTLNGATVAVNQAISAADIAGGRLRWTPEANVHGTALATLQFRVRDDGGTAHGGVDTSTGTYTLTLNVASVNDVPVLGFDSASTSEDTPLAMPVLAAATDADGDTLTLRSAALASGFGAVSIDGGRVIYDPTKAPNQNIDAGESRRVTVEYTIGDAHGGVVTQTITITVNGVAPQLFLGTDGADTIAGSDGGDEMHGGKGNDTYLVDDVLDVVIENKAEGRDLVRASVDFTLGDNVESLTLTGDGSIRGNGNGLDNDITGNDGDNVLWGGRGRDRLTGGDGADTFLFTSTAESRRGVASDHILDFARAEGDIIDLGAIDANVNRKGDQSFRFIGGAEFHGKAGELRFEKKGSDIVVFGDTDGDGKADLQIVLEGLSGIGRADFQL